MSDLFVLDAETRSDVGRGASRRLRHADQVPAIIYGAGKDPVSLTLSHNEVQKHLKLEAFYSHILTINVGSKKEKAVLKAVQRHPVKPRILHLDFLRVKAGEAIHMKVPFHFLNEEECPGVKAGGKISHLMTSVEITCLPKHLPEFIEVDVANLNMDESIHLSEVKLPEGVKLTHDDAEHDQAIIAIHEIKESKEDLEADAAEAELAAEQHAEAEAEHAGEKGAEEAPKAEGDEGSEEGKTEE